MPGSQIASAVCTFPDVGSAVNTAIEILQNDIPIARIELMDELSMKACRAYSNVNLEEKPALFLEFHGPDEDHVRREVDAVRQIANSNSGSAFDVATDHESRSKLWKARHELYYACLNLVPNSSALVTDVCVPISKLTEMVLGAQQLFRAANVTGLWGMECMPTSLPVVRLHHLLPDDCTRLCTLYRSNWTLCFLSLCSDDCFFFFFPFLTIHPDNHHRRSFYSLLHHYRQRWSWTVAPTPMTWSALRIHHRTSAWTCWWWEFPLVPRLPKRLWSCYQRQD